MRGPIDGPMAAAMDDPTNGVERRLRVLEKSARRAAKGLENHEQRLAELEGRGRRRVLILEGGHRP
jgi:hypothetical protein